MNVLELAVIVSAVDRATSVLRGIQGAATSGAARVADGIKGWAGQATMAGEVMAAGAGRIQAGMQSLLAPANQVEDALARVQSVVTPMSGTMSDALGRISGAANEWASSHTEGATQFLDTTYMMISAGLDEVAAVEATRAAMTTAKAAMGDATDTANLLGGVYNTMGDKTANVRDEMTRLGDVVAATQALFQFENLGALNEGLKFAIPVALQTGASFEQLNTALGSLNSSQLQGSMAGTALASAMGNMNKAGKDLGFTVAKTADGGLDLISTIAQIEKKYGNLKAMSPEVQASFRTAFGDEGWRAMSLMIGKSEELRVSLGKVTDSAGTAAKAAAVIENTRTAKWAILNNQLDVLKTNIVAGLAPALESLAPRLESAVRAVAEFVKNNPELVKTAAIVMAITGAVLAVVGPILAGAGAIGMFGGHVLTGVSMVGKFASGLWSLVPALIAGATSAWGFATALLANPITWIVLAIVAAAALIYIYWEPITEFFVGLWDDLKAAFNRGWMNGIVRLLMYFSPVYWISRAFNALSQWLFGFSLAEAGSKVLGSLLDGLSGMWATIVAAFDQGLLQGLAQLFEYFSPISWMAKGLNALSQWLFGLSLADAGSRLIGTLLDGLSTRWDSVLSAFDQGFFQGIAQLFRSFNPLSWMIQALDSMTQWLYGFSLAEAGSAVIGTLMSGLQGAWGLITGAFDQGVLQGIAALLANFSLAGLFAQLLNAVAEEVFGFSLFEAGGNILRTLTAGISAAAAGPVAAVQSVVQQVRNLLPFSPAKAGPLRDLHRVRLIETVADAVRADPLVQAVSGAAAAAMASLPTEAGVPVVARMPQASSAPGAPAASAGGMVVNITIEGSADDSTVSKLEQWARENADMLWSLMQRQQQVASRGAF